MNTTLPPSRLTSSAAREQMQQAREDALKAEFPIGSIVRLRPGEAESYHAPEAAKMKDRIGIVAKHQMYSGSPIVDFPPIGRKKLFTKVFSSPKHSLEVLTVESDIEKWRVAFAEATAKSAAKVSAKKTNPVPTDKS